MMADVINKKTGQYLRSVHTPLYVGNADWIVNPSQLEIDQYKYVPPPPDLDAIEKERLIEEKKRELAISALKTENKLDANGDLVK
jgi:hypothetical protein